MDGPEFASKPDLRAEFLDHAAASLATRDRMYHDFQQRYESDPEGFVRECVEWENGQDFAGYQLEVLGRLVKRKRVAVRGPHALGKTALAAIITIWYALTRDGRFDWKVVTTASAWRQLSKYLWPEIHKWAKRIRWDVVGRAPFSRMELLALSLKLETGEAFAVASDNHELIEGAHADRILYLFDEAKAIPVGTWDAAEGALSGAGEDTGAEALVMAVSTPGEPLGRFYDISRHAPGFEDWATRHVTLAEAIAAGRISREWAQQRRRQWGEASAVYQNRVLGEFATSDEDGVIPLAWVEQANERWHEWAAAGRPGPFVAVGVDVARSGRDQTVLALCFGGEPGLTGIAELRRLPFDDTMATSGAVAGVLQQHGGRAVVDVIGLGAGVVDRLREQNHVVVAFNASERTDAKDRSGELGFRNVRSGAWWRLRELLDPASGSHVALPPDDELIGDLTSPRWRIGSTGRLEIESKPEIRKRLGRSTDCGDAVVMVLSAQAQPLSYSYRSVGKRHSAFGPRPRRLGGMRRGWNT